MENKDLFNKWRSRRWIITVWSMVMITIICILGILFDNSAYVPVVTTLVAIPIAFTSLETINKGKKYKFGGNENDSREISDEK